MESFIAGSTSGAISCFLFQPLDLIKTKLQSSPSLPPQSDKTRVTHVVVDGKLAPKHNFK